MKMETMHGYFISLRKASFLSTLVNNERPAVHMEQHLDRIIHALILYKETALLQRPLFL